MAEISGLSVKVSAATSAFTAGMSRAEDAAGDLALSLRRLSLASESADDNLDEVGNSALRASGGMATFGVSTEGAGFSVRGLSASILGSLVPALVTLSAALVPVVSALGGFVAIAGAIAGLGLVGVMGAIAQNTEELKTAFNSLVDEAMAEFAPVFDAATRVLLNLMGALEATMSELVPSQSVIQSVADSFQALGMAVIDALPALVELAASLAKEFLPPFVDLVEGALQKAPEFIRMLVSDFRRLAPLFVDAGRALAGLLGEMREFGFAALNVIAPALGAIGGAITDSLRAVNRLSPEMRKLAASGSLLAPVLFTLTSLFGGLSAPVLAVVGAIGALFKAWQMNFGNIQGIVSSTVAKLQKLLGNRIPKLVTSAKNAFETWRPVLEPLFNFISRVLGVVVLNAVDSVTSGLTALFQLLSGDIPGAMKTLGGLFKRTFGRIGDLIVDTFSGLSGAAVKAIKSLGAEIGDILEDAVEAAFTPTLTVSGVTLGQVPGATPASELPDSSGTAIPPMPGPSRTATPPQEFNVDVTVEGDTGVIEDVTTEVIAKSERNVNRNTGRTPNL